MGDLQQTTGSSDYLKDYAIKAVEAFAQTMETLGEKLAGQAMSEGERLAEVARGLVQSFDEMSQLASAYARSADIKGIEGAKQIQEVLGGCRS